MAEITLVPGTDTPNQGRNKWNTNDTNLNAELGAVSAALTAHKTSADHDGRYSTEDEVDAKDAVIQTNLNNHKASADHDGSYVKKAGAETIAGAKTFSESVKIVKATNTADCDITANTAQVRVRANAYTDYKALSIELNKNTIADPSWDFVLFAASNDERLICSRDVYAKGKKLATEEYVQDRVKTGINNIPLALYIASPAQNTTYTFPIIGGGTVKIPIVRAINIREYKILTEGVLVTMDDGVVSYQFSQSEINNVLGNNILVPKIITGPATPNMQIKLKLFALKITGGALVETQIYDSGFLMNASLSSGTPTTINMNIITSL
jgi:hypothetical protein